MEDLMAFCGVGKLENDFNGDVIVASRLLWDLCCMVIKRINDVEYGIQCNLKSNMKVVR